MGGEEDKQAAAKIFTQLGEAYEVGARTETPDTRHRHQTPDTRHQTPDTRRQILRALLLPLLGFC
jgi:hypothetical protein